jgi:hypothetical protein
MVAVDLPRRQRRSAQRRRIVRVRARARASLDGGRNGQYVEIARGIHREEYEQALALARELRLRLDRAASGRDVSWPAQSRTEA